MADLFDIAIARKLSDGGGGGGSSDFSTAQVTVTAESLNPLTAEGIKYTTPVNYGVGETNIEPGDTAEVVLYEGHQYIYARFTVTVNSGSAVLITVPYEGADIPFLDITGDCTITIS